MNYVIKCFKNYAVFDGRSSRSEYWSFTLLIYLMAIIIGQGDIQNATWSDDYHIGLNQIIFWIITFVPSLAVSWRRLHDIGKSGWMTLLWLIPLVGWIWILILLFTPSQDNENAYGEMPND